MAERRMFSGKITDSDFFLDMPFSAQALYFHLNMGADDEGFLDKAKKIQRSIGARDDDFKILIAKGFIIPFESGVVVIRHWRIHNYIRSDRFKPTIHQEEKTRIEFDEAKVAHIKEKQEVLPNVIPVGYQMGAQDRLGKVRLDKDNIYSPARQDEIPYEEIVNYLNQQANRNYKSTTKKIRSLIKARWSEGFTLSDFKQVIDTKSAEWGNDAHWSKFLRPDTLFGTKFESYLNQRPVKPTSSVIDDLPM